MRVAETSLARLPPSWVPALPSSSRPAHVPTLEVFSDAAHYARMQQTHIDSSQWQIGGASSVRSLAVHSWFDFVNYAAFNQGGNQGGFDQAASNPPGTNAAQATQFNVLAVLHAGINNLPRITLERLYRRARQPSTHKRRRRPLRSPAANPDRQQSVADRLRKQRAQSCGAQLVWLCELRGL